ncbi:MAG: FtsQ-type POTRA domain-containing protein, partial [Clostridia bacterium]|nr:FtsQ-type POTRA domain-containing protein [Clostridia bacterium]
MPGKSKKAKKAKKARKAALRRAEKERKARKAQHRAAKKEQQRREKQRRRALSGGQARHDPRQRKKAARRRLRRRLLLLALLALLIGSSALLVYGVKSLPVRLIEVEGDSPYSEGVLLETAALSTGQPLLTLPVQRMERSLLTALPWLREVDIDRRLPDRVILRVTPEQPVLRAESAGEEYLVTAEDKILGQAEEMPDADRLPLLLGDFTGVQIAEKLTFAEENDSGIYVDIFAALQDNNLLEDTRRIDLRSLAPVIVVLV